MGAAKSRVNRGLPKSKAAAKKVVVTKQSAKVAAKKAKSHYPKSGGKVPSTWNKGGKEWARVLGRFGLTAVTSSK